MSNIFDNGIEVDNRGMAGGSSYYDIEDLYQAFRERFIKEVEVTSEELLNNSVLFDPADKL